VLYYRLHASDDAGRDRVIGPPYRHDTLEWAVIDACRESVARGDAVSLVFDNGDHWADAGIATARGFRWLSDRARADAREADTL
jgi:hypothetical protein